MASAPATTVQQDRTPLEQRRPASIIVLSTAELAPCTCPEFCERDHDRD